jgi:hypothetical protein
MPAPDEDPTFPLVLVLKFSKGCCWAGTSSGCILHCVIPIYNLRLDGNQVLNNHTLWFI